MSGSGPIPNDPSRPVRGADGDQPDQDEVDALFVEYRRTGDRRLRNRLVEHHLHVAGYYVARFSRSVGSSVEDLHQTALMAVVHAVERFDPSLGVSFRTFASRTIEGELKRYLRDRSWSVRPPRRAQELHLQVRRAGEELTHRLNRAPTVAELSSEIGVDEERVLEALEAGQARSASGLESTDGDESSSLGGVLGGVDPAYRAVEDRTVLRAAISELDEREQLVLQLRFVDELTQPEIAERIGVSQSYVSRILRGTLAQLRSELSPA